MTIVSANYAPGVPNADWAMGDFDYNGFVDDGDVTLLGVFYEAGVAPPAAAKYEVRITKDEGEASESGGRVSGEGQAKDEGLRTKDEIGGEGRNTNYEVRITKYEMGRETFGRELVRGQETRAQRGGAGSGDPRTTGWYEMGRETFGRELVRGQETRAQRGGQETRAQRGGQETRAGVRSTTLEVQGTEYGVRSTGYGVRSTGYGVRSTGFAGRVSDDDILIELLAGAIAAEANRHGANPFEVRLVAREDANDGFRFWLE